ncbi:hypothetical protein J6590_052907 [Homalodisca vitripennis]|nr:hypothetical protein J6590_052907 [Homalodisca vitripennis]
MTCKENAINKCQPVMACTSVVPLHLDYTIWLLGNQIEPFCIQGVSDVKTRQRVSFESLHHRLPWISSDEHGLQTPGVNSVPVSGSILYTERKIKWSKTQHL